MQTPTLPAIQTPTLSAIGAALRGVLVQTVGGRATILSPWQEGDPDTAGILVLQALHPGRATGAELGGREALAVLSGVFSVTLSYPGGTAAQERAAWNLAHTITQAFYRLQLPTDAACPVQTGEPYTTNAGRTPDGRLALAVAVPWRTWAGGLTEENNP